MHRALLFASAVALVAGCGSQSSGGVGDDANMNGGADGGPHDNGDGGSGGDGGVNVDAGNNGGGDGGNGGGDGGVNVDAGNNGGVDGGANVDAGVNVDAGNNGGVDAGSAGVHPIGQSASRSCWSWGGFGTVRPDAPAHIVAFLQDNDGVADITSTAEVYILGDGGMRYLVGWVTIESLGDTGCCQRAAKVPITYYDFVAAAQVIDTSTMWSAEAIFRDGAGNTTTATCLNQWRLNSTPIGS